MPYGISCDLSRLYPQMLTAREQALTDILHRQGPNSSVLMLFLCVRYSRLLPHLGEINFSPLSGRSSNSIKRWPWYTQHIQHWTTFNMNNASIGPVIIWESLSNFLMIMNTYPSKKNMQRKICYGETNVDCTVYCTVQWPEYNLAQINNGHEVRTTIKTRLTASSGFFRLVFGLNAVQVEGRGAKQWGMWGGGGDGVEASFGRGFQPPF